MSNPNSKLVPSARLRVYRLLITLMSLVALCALAFVLLQSCKVSKPDLSRFAKGSLKKMQIITPSPPQPVRRFDQLSVLPADQSGERPVISRQLADFQGRFVILNVWATWCGPCIAELPSLEALQASYNKAGADRLKIIAISQDQHPDDARRFFKQQGFENLDLYYDPSLGFAADLGVPGLPITVFYDPHGLEISRVAGEVDWQSADVADFLAEIMP